MKLDIIKAAMVGFLVAVIERTILDLFPDRPFWYLRELLELPGVVFKGVVRAFLSNDVYDAKDGLAGFDRLFNFGWIFVATFLVALILIRVSRRRMSNTTRGV